MVREGEEDQRLDVVTTSYFIYFHILYFIHKTLQHNYRKNNLRTKLSITKSSYEIG